MVEFRVPFTGHCDLDQVLKIIVILNIEDRNPKVGVRTVTYHFRVTLTLPSDIFCRIIVSRTYLLKFWDGNPKFGVCMHLGMVVECRVLFTGHCGLKPDI